MHVEREDLDLDARRSLIRTMNRNPYDVWTLESLARATGLSTGAASRALRELVGAGLVRQLAGPDDEYTIAGSPY
jgi:DNA-binding MarR family transcriptional regulator